jgi:MoaA/NifB/PqqE/SkfB family radical SAM enzyme
MRFSLNKPIGWLFTTRAGAWCLVRFIVLVHWLFSWFLVKVIRRSCQSAWTYTWIKVLGPAKWDWIDTFTRVSITGGRIRQLRSQGKYFPITQTWFITSACNTQPPCPGCPKVNSCPKTMTEDDWVGVGQEAIANGTRHIGILGGEPLIEKEMIKRVKAKLGNSVIFLVFTNGDLLTKEDAEDFRRLRIGLVINVGSGRKNDVGAYRAVELARKHHVFCIAGITVNRQNYLEVISDRYLADLVARGVSVVTFFHYMPTGVAEDQQYLLTRGDFLRVEESLCRPKKVPIRIFHYSRCLAADGMCSIEPDGSVKACAFCTGPASLGNVKTASVMEIFNSVGFRVLRSLKSSQSCMVHNHTDKLKDLGYLRPEIASIIRDSNFFPQGYVRQMPWGVRLTMWIRRKMTSTY